MDKKWNVSFVRKLKKIIIVHKYLWGLKHFETCCYWENIQLWCSNSSSNLQVFYSLYILLFWFFILFAMSVYVRTNVKSNPISDSYLANKIDSVSHLDSRRCCKHPLAEAEVWSFYIIRNNIDMELFWLLLKLNYREGERALERCIVLFQPNKVCLWEIRIHWSVK